MYLPKVGGTTRCILHSKNASTYSLLCTQAKSKDEAYEGKYIKEEEEKK